MSYPSIRSEQDRQKTLEVAQLDRSRKYHKNSVKCHKGDDELQCAAEKIHLAGPFKKSNTTFPCGSPRNSKPIPGIIVVLVLTYFQVTNVSVSGPEELEITFDDDLGKLQFGSPQKSRKPQLAQPGRTSTNMAHIGCSRLRHWSVRQLANATKS
uniref:CUB domain-containing protein n=1 Tax=Angiostrongylus cantonensis TaxID=6313 RepID=A0A0K0DIH9_ANGCA